MTSILYLSCHEVLEHDEVSMLDEMGHSVYSISASTGTVLNTVRSKTYLEAQINDIMGPRTPSQISEISDEFLDFFDVIIVMHMSSWIDENRHRLTGKRVILRTIGQNISHNEEHIASMGGFVETVRYSPKERLIPGYAGEAALIRFAKDEQRFSGWDPANSRILCFGNQLLRRPEHTSLRLLLESSLGFDLELYGAGNTGLSSSKGVASDTQQIQLYQSSGAYYNHHTLPASYTLGFIEAMMMGMPIVTPSRKAFETSTSELARNCSFLCELTEIMSDGCGFAVDTPSDATTAFALIFSDLDYAKSVGNAARVRAIKMFGRESVSHQWRALLGS